MSPLPHFCDHTIKVITPGNKVVHGNDVDDWANVTEREIPGCWVEATTTEENNYRRDTVRAGYDILIPAGAEPPTPTDRIRHPLSEDDYAVKGDVMQVRSSSGLLDHFFCYVERWKSHG